jgi:hypothetical protein
MKAVIISFVMGVMVSTMALAQDKPKSSDLMKEIDKILKSNFDSIREHSYLELGKTTEYRKKVGDIEIVTNSLFTIIKVKRVFEGVTVETKFGIDLGNDGSVDSFINIPGGGVDGYITSNDIVPVDSKNNKIASLQAKADERMALYDLTYGFETVAASVDGAAIEKHSKGTRPFLERVQVFLDSQKNEVKMVDFKSAESGIDSSSSCSDWRGIWESMLSSAMKALTSSEVEVKVTLSTTK